MVLVPFAKLALASIATIVSPFPSALDAFKSRAAAALSLALRATRRFAPTVSRMKRVFFPVFAVTSNIALTVVKSSCALHASSISVRNVLS
jgi:hypothetical protein